MKRYAYTVSGTVQGVGFRYFTKSTADRFHLAGWVRNTWEGNVEGEVQGDESACLSFFEMLRRGPACAFVESVVMSECPVLENDISFKIKFSGI